MVYGLSDSSLSNTFPNNEIQKIQLLLGFFAFKLFDSPAEFRYLKRKTNV
jgi:hypothetical protein